MATSHVAPDRPMPRPAGGPSSRPGRHRGRTLFVLRVLRRRCRRGLHRYGADLPAAGGVLRRTCRDCGAVSIDLREVTVNAAPTVERRRFPGPRIRA